LALLLKGIKSSNRWRSFREPRVRRNRIFLRKTSLCRLLRKLFSRKCYRRCPKRKRLLRWRSLLPRMRY